MNHLLELCFFLITAAFCYSFSSGTVTSAQSLNFTCKDTTSRPPVFKDGGKTIDNLQKEYDCKVIEFENWEDDDATDSSLTVLLINSRILGSISPDKNQDLLEYVAAQIKKSLAYPQNYKSYYIIFVTEKGEGFMKGRVHSLGGEIPGKLL